MWTFVDVVKGDLHLQTNPPEEVGQLAPEISIESLASH